MLCVASVGKFIDTAQLDPLQIPKLLLASSSKLFPDFRQDLMQIFQYLYPASSCSLSNLVRCLFQARWINQIFPFFLFFVFVFNSLESRFPSYFHPLPFSDECFTILHFDYSE